MTSVQFIFRYIKRNKWKYMWGIIALLVVDLTSLLIPQFTGEITDGLQAHSLFKEDLLFNILKILIAGLIIAFGRYFWRYHLFGACRIIESDIREDMFEHLTTLSASYFNKNKTGDLMSHFTNDLHSVRMSTGPAVITTFDATVMTVMVLFKMITYVDLKLTIIAVIPLLLIALLGSTYGKAEEARFSKKQQAFSEMTDKVQESISGVRVIKAFVQEENELTSFSKANKNNMYHNLRVVKLQAAVMPLLDVIIGVSSLIALLYGGYLTLIGNISLGRFIAFMQYIGMLVWPMIAAGESITIISQGIASIKRITKIFNEMPEVKDAEKTIKINDINGDICINNLTFNYPDTILPALSDVSIKINAGGSLGIVGSTGSGKTTLTDLLLRLYNSPKGSITIDGFDINDLPLKTLRRNIAYVPQDNFLFSDTIRNNIAFGLDEVDINKIKEAAKEACVHENIMDFPMDYETVIGERGTSLSGGQKQRCSIARAFLKNSPILILDDSLSAVDTDTEEQILKNLAKYRSNRTTIIIAHRISSIQHADNIAVFDEGRLIEYGSHTELCNLCGLYKKMYDKQLLEKQLEENE